MNAQNYEQKIFNILNLFSTVFNFQEYDVLVKNILYDNPTASKGIIFEGFQGRKRKNF